MKPYPEYHPVDFDYVKQLPKGWKLLPNIAIFNERIQRGYQDEELLSVTIKKGLIKQSELEEKKDSSNDDKSNYKLVNSGDIAYNKMRMWQGAVGYSPFRGLVSPAYVVLKPRMEINPKFFHYQFRSNFYTNYSRKASYGICDDMLSLRYIDFKRMYSIMPPLETQNKIVAYLEEKEKMIGAFVERKERLIELNKEKINSIIQKVFTYGINITDTREINIDWHKAIPKNWVIKPLKHFVNINQLALPETTNSKYRFKYIDISSVNFEGLVNEPVEMNFGEAPSRARRILRKNDTIISTVRTYLKAIAFIGEIKEPLIASTGFAVLSPKKEMHPEYLKYCISCSYFLNKVNQLAIGVNYPSINIDKLGAIKILVPNSLDEQQELINSIKEKIENNNSIYSLINNELKLIGFFKISALDNFITGKYQIP